MTIRYQFYFSHERCFDNAKTVPSNGIAENELLKSGKFSIGDIHIVCPFVNMVHAMIRIKLFPPIFSHDSIWKEKPLH